MTDAERIQLLEHQLTERTRERDEAREALVNAMRRPITFPPQAPYVPIPEPVPWLPQRPWWVRPDEPRPFRVVPDLSERWDIKCLS